jgi:hypothetical protein
MTIRPNLDDDDAFMAARRHAALLSDRSSAAAQLPARNASDARHIGILGEITPGLEIWTPEVYDLPPRGGIVLAVEAGFETVDPDTGELATVPNRYRCYDSQGWPSHAFPTVFETELTRSSVSVPPPQRLVLAVRRFAGEVCQHKRRRKQLTLDPFEADLMLDAARLVAVLMGGR